jgi:predicted enzyme related to lactoylglutathione lyase
MTPMTSDFGVEAIGQIFVNVHDVERAVKFYRDTLGIKFLFQAPPNLAFFDCGGIRLMIGIADKPELNHPASIIYYKVADIQGAHQTLKSRGVDFISEPHLVAKMPDHDLWLADFRDSEENVLVLMSEVPRQQAK